MLGTVVDTSKRLLASRASGPLRRPSRAGDGRRWRHRARHGRAAHERRRPRRRRRRRRGRRTRIGRGVGAAMRRRRPGLVRRGGGDDGRAARRSARPREHRRRGVVRVDPRAGARRLEPHPRGQSHRHLPHEPGRARPAARDGWRDREHGVGLGLARAALQRRVHRVEGWRRDAHEGDGGRVRPGGAPGELRVPELGRHRLPARLRVPRRRRPRRCSRCGRRSSSGRRRRPRSRAWSRSSRPTKRRWSPARRGPSTVALRREARGARSSCARTPRCRRDHPHVRSRSPSRRRTARWDRAREPRSP